ncbi:C4-type zinc ribbon domain-containing protein [Candidatus Oleimmundimicrobium sp.]|uniref:zinc ribbon domain-containing protein n=1 Tax=Candidatus Oleimmundimicrobium sp. TaxID=3060597 RepID=UPI002717BBDA|nr:C4-type zinc ribbon domain-containing protein [Candidatus Oleimmundimicrobium sp.]MDO8885492.1 C4-type zinc ribbon domain-containing protein [Candidatus Oleimmundimicrobium sp.]
MNKEIILLKEIQDVDFKRDGLLSKKESLYQVKKMDELKKEFAKLRRSYDLKKAELNGETKKRKKLEGQLEVLTEKINKEDKKLYGGLIKSPKELVDIQNEIKSLNENKDELESDLLEKLENIEKLEKELKVLVESLRKIKNENDVLMAEYKLAISEIDEAFQAESVKKNKLTARLNKKSLFLYETLRKKDNLVVADLKDGICQGCHVKLPSEELDKILSADKLWRCPNCERILNSK